MPVLPPAVVAERDATRMPLLKSPRALALTLTIQLENAAALTLGLYNVGGTRIFNCVVGVSYSCSVFQSGPRIFE